VLVDTPGHGKLRHFASEQLSKTQNLKGIIFLVDAAALSPGDAGKTTTGLTSTAEYLHDVLLALQKRYTSAKSSKGPKETPVLIAANKLDLFTALPPSLVKAALEKEITSVRNTRSKGLKDSGIAMGEDAIEEEREWLGDGGDGKFEFKQMEELNVFVDVIGGNVLGQDGPSVGKWWDWIAAQL
jgi:signal recognition particle receptor subunit beta